MIERSDASAFGETASTNSFVNGAWLSTRVMPAHDAARGGDWCETFVLSKDVVALSIGDVCGHGEDQFEAMVLIRDAVREAALLGADPVQTLAFANQAVCAFEPRLHATALFAWFDTGRGVVTFANAGHPPPLLVGAAGSWFLTDGDADVPLGVERDFVPQLRVASAPPDSLLVLYTDGVTEHERQPLRGEAQLRAAAASVYASSAMPAATLIEERIFAAGRNHDDAAILTVWTARAAPPTGFVPGVKGAGL